MNDMDATHKDIIGLFAEIDRRRPVLNMMLIIHAVLALLSAYLPVVTPYWLAAIPILTYYFTTTHLQLREIKKLNDKVRAELDDE